MEFLEQKILRLLKDGPMRAGTIRNDPGCELILRGNE